LTAPNDPYAPGYREGLEHAGITADRLTFEDVAGVADLDVLALAGEGQANEAWLNAIAALLRRGGTVVISGGTWGLDPLIGVKSIPDRWLAQSTLNPPGQELPIWPTGRGPVPFFGGPAVEADSTQVLAQTDAGTVGIAYRSIAGGHVLFVAPHFGQTFGQIAMGGSVYADAIGPSDGSARMTDGKFRAEDGTRLSFDRHRERTTPKSAPFFADPFVDVLREIWIRALLWGAVKTGTVPTLVWTWPDSAHGTAFLVVDVDESGDEDIHILRRPLERYGVRTAWFTSLNYISLEMGRSLRKRGDEIGLLVTGEKAWNVERLRTQYLTMHRQLAVPVLHSVRATGGQWRGLTAPYDSIESVGARISIAKGGRQPGTQGFLFGTSHPFFLPRKDTLPGLVCEIPQTIWLGDEVTSPDVMHEVVERTAAVHGTLVIGLRARDARNPAILTQLETAVQHVRARGLQWITPEQLYNFERGRRGLRRTLQGASIQLIADTEIDPMTLMIAGSGRGVTLGGRRIATETIQRYGMEFTGATFPMDPKSRAEIQIDLNVAAAA